MVFCAVCKQKYKHADDIYAADCGHAYHFACLQQWKSRSSTCPQCPNFKAGAYKLYLNFEKKSKEKPNVPEWLAKVNANNVGAAQSEDEDEESEDEDESEIEDESGDKRKSTKKLEAEQKSLVDDLINQINTLTTKNEENSKVIALKNAEILRLKEASAQTSTTLSQISLETKVESLEQKVKLMSSLLEKEIDKSTRVIFEKDKLTAQLAQSMSVKNEPKNEPNQQIVAQMTNTKKWPEKHNKQERDVLPLRQQQQPRILKTEKEHIVDKCCIIRGLTTMDQLVPPQMLVQQLAKGMNIRLNENDVERIDISDDKRCLKVFFQNLSMKNRFYDKRNALGRNAEFSRFSLELTKPNEVHNAPPPLLNKIQNKNHYVVPPKMNEELDALLKSAYILNAFGYINIYKRDDAVYAQKFGCVPVKISNQNQIDNLKKAENNNFVEAQKLYYYATGLKAFGYTDFYIRDHNVYVQRKDSVPIKIRDSSHVDELKNEDDRWMSQFYNM